MTRLAQVCRPSQGDCIIGTVLGPARPGTGTGGEVMHVWLLMRPKQPSLSIR